MTLIKRMRPMLGTFVELAIRSDLPSSQCETAINQAFQTIALIQNLLSFHSLESDLTRINRAQGAMVTCHPLSVRCLRLARAVTRVSEGHFNFTVGGAMVRLGGLPSHNFLEIYHNHLVDIGDWQDVQVGHMGVQLLRPVLVTLDGIAKGFAVDMAINALKSCGISAGWINAGGDICVFGDLILPITVRDHKGGLHQLGSLQNAAIATSGCAVDRETPGMLLDFEGSPLGPSTWTVLAASAWRADALTKVAASVAPNRRHELMSRLGGRWVPLTTNH